MSLTLLVPLVNADKLAMINMEDRHLLERKWRVNRDGYVMSSGFQMGRFVANPPNGLEVDHINRNKLDNRRSNLRNVTRSQNMQNVGPTIRNTSGYVGVDFCRQHKKWRARFRLNGKTSHLGFYNTPDEAGAVVASAKEAYFASQQER